MTSAMLILCPEPALKAEQNLFGLTIMSVNQKQTISNEPCLNAPYAGIELLITPKQKDLGGFSVRRTLPIKERKMVGPWIFFDHMGPALFPAGKGLNVRPHPHINIATVTYLFEGEILHRDSVGSYQTIQPGDINLMVAGNGITHSERERPEVTRQEHRLNGLQLWLALPEEYEEIEPAFYHYSSDDIPQKLVEEVPVRVLIGSAYGLESPVKTYAETLYIEAHLQAGQSIRVPKAQERAVYVAEGKIRSTNTHLDTYTMAIFEPDAEVALTAETESRIAIIGGEAIGKRYIEWNFVSSRKERIEQAKLDWQNQCFEKVKGDEEEFIKYP